MPMGSGLIAYRQIPTKVTIKLVAVILEMVLQLLLSTVNFMLVVTALPYLWPS
jgi:hypothetical protein